MKNLFALVTCIAIGFTSASLIAQTQKGELKKGVVVASKITANEKHQFKIELGDEQFAFLKLEQKGVDVRVRTYDPSGRMIAEFDTPNGRFGPEIVTLNSTKKGAYVFEVIPFDENEPAGEYELCLNKVEPIPVTPEGKIDLIFLPWDSDQTPGAAVSVVKDGEIVFKKGYGIANLEYGIPNSPSTVFHVASVSKQFTVFSVLLLEKQGKLSLDDDIRKFIPEVPDFGKTITLRHLASHTSGMRDQWALLGMAGWRNDDVITKEHIMKLVAKQQALNFDPGEEFAYCNTGFTLLAEVVARVSGMTFNEFTKANIFERLEMHNSQFYDDHERIVKNRAYSYQNSNGLKKSVLNFANVGATSLFTTAEDLSRWAMNFDSQVVGDADMIKKMNTLATLNDGETFGGALGQFVGKYKGLNEIQHGGADAGYRSYLCRFPDQGVSVALVCNDAGFNPVALAHKVVDVFLADEVKEMPEPESNAPGNADSAPEKSFDVATVDLSKFTGRFYSEELSTDYRFNVIAGKLVAQHQRNSDFNLMPVDKDAFVGFFGQLKFVRGTEDEIIGFKVSDGRIRNVWFQKLDD